MITDLEAAKLYLRVDHDEEDALIASFIETAEDICAGVLRYPLTDFLEDGGTVPEAVKQAVFFITAQFYELRESLDLGTLTDTVVRLLFAYRLESW